ncbi:MAG: oxygen-independent coproporphyrinogen III oxidase [Myxococcota bacterium]
MITPSPELLVRLDRPGPRYTSYPTVPTWVDGFPEAEVTAAMRAIDRPIDVYVHIPFCREQCWFCGCNQVVSSRQEAGDRYVAAVGVALAALPLPAAVVDVARIHFGGGTPTWLDVRQLDALYDLLDARFRGIPGVERSVEIDPDVTSDAQLDHLVQRGVTRISLGVQSTDPRVLAAVNRPQSTDRIRALTARARDHGMRGLNVDLVYGLPHQDAVSFGATIDEVIGLGPDRLAVYSYAHVPWLKKHQQRIDAAALPGPVDKLALFLLARERLLDAGYVEVGMDHFARPDDALAIAARDRALHRNFMGYTTRADLPLVGVGVSAISELDGVYAQDQPHLGAWYRAVERGEGPRVVKGLRLTAEDRLRRDVIASLMCNFRVVKAAIEARHGIRFDETFAEALAALAPLVDDGLCAVTPDGIEVTPLGRLLVRNVAMAFDDRLGSARFSRTV